MQRTSSCGQLDLLRKAFTTLDTQVRRRDGLTATAAELGTQLPRRAFYSTPSVAGGITALRKTVLSDGIVQIDQLHKMAEDLQLREKKLELGPELQLFDWPTVNQPTKALTGTSILRSCLVKNRRQSDSQSCHTDALQVLKDALHALKHGENRSAYSLFMQNELATKTGSEMPRFLLPSFLQKTNQRNRALVHDHFDGASQLQPPRFDLLFSDKSVLIGQHRYKYLGMLGIKQCNNFLTIKAYYNAQKVLAHLADFTDSNARELYLMQLQEVRDSGDLGVSGER
jgi:hypothetical protein